MKKMRYYKLLLLFFLLISCVNKPAIITSDKAGWMKIIEATANVESEYREFEIIGADKFSALKVKVKEATLQLDSLKVFHENDTIERFALKSKVRPGRESKTIYLKIPQSSLRTIAFTYKTLPNTAQKKAIVEIWGLKKD